MYKRQGLREVVETVNPQRDEFAVTDCIAEIIMSKYIGLPDMEDARVEFGKSQDDMEAPFPYDLEDFHTVGNHRSFRIFSRFQSPYTTQFRLAYTRQDEVEVWLLPNDPLVTKYKMPLGPYTVGCDWHGHHCHVRPAS